MYKRGGRSDTFREDLCIHHLHAEERSLIFHAYMFGAISQFQLSERREMMEGD